MSTQPKTGVGRSYLLPPGADLVGFVCDLLGQSALPLQRCLVVFPGRRPGAILARELARRAGHALPAPHIAAIDDYVEAAAADCGLGRRRIEAADGAALIWQLHPELHLPGGTAALSLEEFLAWGFALFADFEELLLEGIDAKQLTAVEALAREPLPDAFGRQLAHMGQWYGDFYRALGQRALATRSSTYDWLSRQPELPGQSDYDLVVAAGFYGLSGAEQRVLQQLLSHPNAVLVLRDGPGIERTIKRLDLQPTKTGEAPPPPALRFLCAGDSHGQVLAAADEIVPGSQLSRTVLVLPKSDTVFPVINHLLPRLGTDWNVSMGYPLARTPLAGLLDALAQAHECREGDRYFLPHYLRLMLHPYVKNLSLDGASYPTRILFHAIEEALNKRGRRLVSPLDLVTDAELMGTVTERLAGMDLGPAITDGLFAHLTKIHELVLHPFEHIASVADFAAKVQAVVSAASAHSNASKHPYAAGFFREMLKALSGLEHSLLADRSLNNVRTYFALLARYTSQSTAPLPGTPLRGLQVLGFLETRNLRFDRVVMLDVNEGVLPVVSPVDTLLPQALRQQLGLTTAIEREQIDRYHFANLVAGAREAVLCHSQGDGAQRSRLLEQLVWQQQQQQRTLAAGAPSAVHFAASFSQGAPAPLAKSPAMQEAIARLTYSPTMLDCYLHCGLRFCQQYLMRAREKEEAAAEVDAAEVGELVHRVLEDFFTPRCKAGFTPRDADYPDMDRCVDAVFDDAFGAEGDGNSFLIRTQVRTRMRRVLDFHRQQLAGTTVDECERKYDRTMTLPGVGPVPVNGKIDRVDRRGGTIVIVDYKTGGGKLPSFENFMAGREQWPHWLRSVQLPFYIMLYRIDHPEVPLEAINSELMLLKTNPIGQKALFGPKDDHQTMYDAYLGAITTLVSEIKDPDRPFADAWKPAEECPGCAYQAACGRGWLGARRRR